MTLRNLPSPLFFLLKTVLPVLAAALLVMGVVITFVLVCIRDGPDRR